MALRSAAFALAALVLAAAPALGQPGQVITLPPLALSGDMTDAQIDAALDGWLGDLERQDVFNGALLIARDGRDIYTGAFGVADLATGARLDADTRFPVASIGKIFTQIAIAQLIQAGRLSPDDTVGELLPDYPIAATRSATIDQLLRHRAGVGDLFGPAFRDAPKDQFRSNADYYRFVANLPAAFEPGAQETYCNGCYIVLGEIIARLSGQSYEDHISEHVFAAAGMTRSGFFRRDQLPANTATFTGRPRGPESDLVDVSDFHGLSGNAAGDSYSTLRDMLAFDAALREHRLLNADLTAQVLRGQPETGRAVQRVAFAGGGPGVNAISSSNGAWTVIVLSNWGPPAGQSIGQAVFPLLAGAEPQ